jgi:anti-sigma B factor antagonist
MAGSSDVVPPLERPERGSQTKVARPALSDVERWPGARRQLLGAQSRSAGAVPELQAGLIMDGLTVAGQASGPVGTDVASLGLTEWTMGSSVIVSVTGEVDIATAVQLSQALGAALRRGPEGLICDLSGVGFLGAAGLTVLLVARRRAIACHARFDLVCPQPLPRRAISLVGLDAVFSLHDYVPEAAAAQARREGRPVLATAARAK